MFGRPRPLASLHFFTTADAYIYSSTNSHSDLQPAQQSFSRRTRQQSQMKIFQQIFHHRLSADASDATTRSPRRTRRTRTGLLQLNPRTQGPSPTRHRRPGRPGLCARPACPLSSHMAGLRVLLSHVRTSHARQPAGWRRSHRGSSDHGRRPLQNGRHDNHAHDPAGASEGRPARAQDVPIQA